MLRDQFWNRLGWRGAVALAAAVLCGVSSLYTFWLDWPSLRDVALFNPIHLGDQAQNPAMIWNLKIVILVCAGALIWSRAWLDLAVLAWLALIMSVLREFEVWHLVIPMAWIAAPIRRNYVRAIRLAFLLTVMALVFGDWFSPSWMGRLYWN
jgi:hypothetical protein